MKAVHFGAGNIGRGFVGLLLHEGGYELVFSDVAPTLVETINAASEYTVHEVGPGGGDKTVTGFRAINSQADPDAVADEVASADVVTTAVGPNILPFVAPHILEGLARRSADAKPLQVMACENAIGAHAVRRGEVAAGQRVLVVGAGPIGLAAMLFAKLRGAQVTAIEGRRDRLDFALRELGIASAVQLGEGDEAELSRLTGGEFFDVVFDATGSPAAMERGFRFIAHGGRYVLVSIVQGDIRFSDPEFHKREATLLSSRNATAEDFAAVMAAMRAGEVPDRAMRTHRLTLAGLPEGFPRLLDPAEGVIKAIVEC